MPPHKPSGIRTGTEVNIATNVFLSHLGAARSFTLPSPHINNSSQLQPRTEGEERELLEHLCDGQTYPGPAGWSSSHYGGTV